MARVVAKGTGEKEIYLQIHPLPSGSCHTRVFIRLIYLSDLHAKVVPLMWTSWSRIPQ